MRRVAKLIHALSGRLTNKDRVCVLLHLIYKALSGGECFPTDDCEKLTSLVNFGFDDAEQERAIQIVIAAAVQTNIQNEPVNRMSVNELKETLGKSSDGLIILIRHRVV